MGTKNAARRAGSPARASSRVWSLHMDDRCSPPPIDSYRRGIRSRTRLAVAQFHRTTEQSPTSEFPLKPGMWRLG